MNKKGQSEGGGGLVSAKLIIVILVVLVVISMFVIMYRMGLLDKIRDVIPGFNVGGGGSGGGSPIYDAVIAGENVKIMLDDGAGRCKIVDGVYSINYDGRIYNLEWWNGQKWDNVNKWVATDADSSRYDLIKNMFLGVGLTYFDIDGNFVGKQFYLDGESPLVINFEGKKYNVKLTSRGFTANVQLAKDEPDPLLEKKSLRQLYNERNSPDSPFEIFEFKGAEGKTWNWKNDNEAELIERNVWLKSGYLYVKMKNNWKGSLELAIEDKDNWFKKHLVDKGEVLRWSDLSNLGSGTVISIRLQAGDYFLIDIDKSWGGYTFRLLSDLERQRGRGVIEKADSQIDSDVSVSNTNILLSKGDTSPKDYSYYNGNLYSDNGNQISKLSNEQVNLIKSFEKTVPPIINFNGQNIKLSVEKIPIGNPRNDLFVVAELSTGEKYALSSDDQINYYNSNNWVVLYGSHRAYADALYKKRVMDDLIRECAKKR